MRQAGTWLITDGGASMRPTESSVEGETLPMAIYSQAKGTIRPDFKISRKKAKIQGMAKIGTKKKEELRIF